MIDSAALRARLAGRSRSHRARRRPGRARPRLDPPRRRLQNISRRPRPRRRRRRPGRLRREQGPGSAAEDGRDRRPAAPLAPGRPSPVEQGRKGRGAFDVVHSVDSARCSAKLDEAAAAAGTHARLLVQVDLAGEATKHGARPRTSCRAIFDGGASGCAPSRVVGLMLLPPAVDDPKRSRPYFRALRGVRDRLLDARRRRRRC